LRNYELMLSAIERTFLISSEHESTLYVAVVM